MYSTKDFKKDLLVGMNAIMIAMNNEEAYFNEWIYIIPDDVDEAELEYIAENETETFDDAVECFLRCMRKYGKDGLFIDDRLYL